MGVMNALVFGFALILAQPAQWGSIVLDPPTPLATSVHWTITLGAPFCGGFRIGDGVYLQPQPPLALPGSVSADAVLFDGQPADVSLQGDVLRVRPSHTLTQPLFCQKDARQFTVELAGSLGLTNPPAGDYAVDVWLGSGGLHQQLPVTVGAPTAASGASVACGPLQANVDAATSTLQANNAALGATFDAIRVQTQFVATEVPELASTQTDLVQQLDDLRAKSNALAADGWNPSIASATSAIEWADGSAPADIAALQSAARQSGGAQPASVARVIELVQLAQQQAQDGNTASEQVQSTLQQLGDCGLGIPPAP